MSVRPAATRASLLALAYLGFISLGLPDGLLGVGWPAAHTDLGVPLPAVGFVITAAVAGYTLSSVAAGFSIARLGVGRLLAGSTALAGTALTGFALAPNLPVMVGAALVLGLGSGAIDAALNAYAAGQFSARHMNWLHASFGLGAAIGPLVMTGVLASGLAWRWGYASVATGQALLAAAFAVTAGAWSVSARNAAQRSPAAGTEDGSVSARNAAQRSPAAGTEDGSVSARNAAQRSPAAGTDGDAARPAVAPPGVGRVRKRDTFRLPAVWLGALAFAVYSGAEVVAGLWAYTLLTAGRGLGPSAAGVCVAAYWGSLFAGRVLFGAVADRVDAGRAVTAMLSAMILGAVLVALPAGAWLAVVGLVLVGLAEAPVFPLLTLTTGARVGDAHADRAIGVQVGAAGLGGALLPTAVGVLLDRGGVELLGPALVALTVVLLGLYLTAARIRSA